MKIELTNDTFSTFSSRLSRILKTNIIYNDFKLKED